MLFSVVSFVYTLDGGEEMNANESALQNCLFFTANRLSNVLRRLANDAYAETGVATSHLYLLIVVYQYPGISITELSEKLDVAPSTCTRLDRKSVV